LRHLRTSYYSISISALTKAIAETGRGEAKTVMASSPTRITTFPPRTSAELKNRGVGRNGVLGARQLAVGLMGGLLLPGIRLPPCSFIITDDL
jgi:hypothetical protein